MDKSTWSKLCVNDLTEVIRSVLTKHDIPYKALVICKRNKTLKDGDMIVPAGLIQSKNLPTEKLQALLDELNELMRTHKWKLSRVTAPPYCFLAFHFHREFLYNSILISLWTSNVLIKTSDYNQEEKVMIYYGVKNINKLYIEDLRSWILLQHIVNLLKCNGYDVSIIPRHTILSTETKHLINKIGLDPYDFGCDETDFTVQVQPFSEVEKKYNLQKCKYLKMGSCTHDDRVTQSHCGGTGDANLVCEGNSNSGSHEKGDMKRIDIDLFSVDLKQFMEESQVRTEKGNYEPSLQVDVPISNDIGNCTDIMEEVLYLQRSLDQSDGSIIVIHLDSERRSYHQQLIDLSWKALFGQQNVKQIHINYGPVTSRQGTSKHDVLSAEDFLDLRFQQMKDAAVMKYGDKVKGPNWEETICKLTVACMKFEFLTTNHRNIVKLDLSEGQEFGGGVDNRAGSFVMYNCARLSTLFKHFEENVSKGVYLPLPDISTVDFSTLREEDEWELFYNYIFVYPELIIETTEQFNPEDSIVSGIQTHKVCNFLISLSRHLSSYYSRTHVLGENRAHLLPTMYARLYLLKVIHRIMCHGLGLLGITPLQQL